MSEAASMKWYWFSFVDDAQKFLGACIVQASDLRSAVATASRWGCMPSVNVAREALWQEIAAGIVPPPEFRNRPLNRWECVAYDKAIGGDGTIDRVVTR